MSTIEAPPRHAWRIVAPWYRWARVDGAEPERAAAAHRPALHKFASTRFVQDFLRDPQRSVCFDEDLDVHQDVEPIPMAQLRASDGRLRSLSRTRLIPSQTRKLFLPAHQRFYLVAVGLHCEQPGFPRVDPRSVDQMGFVVRRHRVEVPAAARPQGARLLRELTQARARVLAEEELDAAKERSRVLHPFVGSRRSRVALPGPASVAAHRDLELARRRLQTWSSVAGLEHRTEGWVAGEAGTFGAWVPMADEPAELIEQWYPMRSVYAPPDDPEHAAHDGTIFYGAVPTSSDEVTVDGTARFSATDTYEIRVFARPDIGDCPGPLVWSSPTDVFRVASFFDPTGCAQRPIEIRLPDFAELEASTALPSVRMTSPPASNLQFAATGKVPSKGKVGGGEEICFFSIPLITIIALFVLRLFLPVVIIAFQLWWMLRLKFCIPPSAEFEADLASELHVSPPELSATASLDVDVLPGVNQAALGAVLSDAFNPRYDPELEYVPAGFRTGDRLTTTYTNDPLVKLVVGQGVGSGDGSPLFTTPVAYTTRVRLEEVVHP